MSAKTPATPAVLNPSEAAARLGLPLKNLVAIIRRHRYSYTEIAPGGRPGDRGRNRWGLTEAQLAAILRGQSRHFVQPEPEKAEPRPSAASPDGRSRLRGGPMRI
jgi:hypothetical protein